MADEVPRVKRQVRPPWAWLSGGCRVVLPPEIPNGVSNQPLELGREEVMLRRRRRAVGLVDADLQLEGPVARLSQGVRFFVFIDAVT